MSKRYPPGAKLSQLARLQDECYVRFRRLMRPNIFGVVATPMISHDFYAGKQREQWERMPATREQLAHGLPVWRDPFDRENRKPPSYVK
uniref:NADH dehydrogenase [ubiquinone] 1 beta subcomplex subunit 9 n=1 Tax=Globodera rostochiensis TaxID=31243 RepID=A0A914IAZ0_GLORO